MKVQPNFNFWQNEPKFPTVQVKESGAHGGGWREGLRGSKSKPIGGTRKKAKDRAQRQAKLAPAAIAANTH
jgi:hypothetical protein